MSTSHIFHYGTALRATAETASERTLLFLLEKGADMNITGGFFGSILYTATWHNQIPTRGLLIANSADVSPPVFHFDGIENTALKYVIKKGVRSAVQFLFENGTDVNAQIEDFDSALKLAEDSKRENITKIPKAHPKL